MNKKGFVVFGSILVLLAGCSFNNVFSSSLDQGCGGFNAPLVDGYSVRLEGQNYFNALIEKDETDLSLQINITKRKEAKIQSFSLASSYPITIWEDKNDNGSIDFDETSYDLNETPTSVNWTWNEKDEEDNSSSALAGYCVMPHANKERLYKIKKEGLFDRDFVITMSDVTYTGENDNIYVKDKLSDPNVIKDVKSYNVYINNPEERITIEELSHNGVYNSKFKVNDFDEIFKFVGIKNAENTSTNFYEYEYNGLDGMITVMYEVHIPRHNKPIPGEFDHKLNVLTHDHVTSPLRTLDNGIKIEGCSCGVYETYEMLDVNAENGFDTDTTINDDRLGVRGNGFNWEIDCIRPGRYDVYVKAYLDPAYPDRGWWTPELEREGPMAYYVGYLDEDNVILPCDDVERLYSANFPASSTFVWSTKRIFEIDITSDVKGISLDSGNYNGRMNDHLIHIEGIKLVPHID